MSITAIIHTKPGEEVHIVARKHLAVHSPHVLLAVALFFLPFFLMFPLMRWQPYGSYVFVVLVIIGVLHAIKTFVKWYYTVFVVTSDRVIDVFQKGLFDRIVTNATYDVIQDVSYRKKGLMATLMDVGWITIQTAGSNTAMQVRDIHNPQVVMMMINQARRESTNTVGSASGGQDRGKLGKLLTELEDDEVRELVKGVAKKRREKAEEEFFNGDEEI